MKGHLFFFSFIWRNALRCLLGAGLGVTLIAAHVYAFNNGLARTPPMGWNTFNQFGGVWTPDNPPAGQVNVILKAVADSMVSMGLKDCGYIYVNADGANGGSRPFWPGEPGFVNWAKPNADYMHSKGLKFGVFTSSNTNAENVVADLVAAGVDFCKFDAWTTPPTSPTWKTLGDALLAKGKSVLYSSHSTQPGESNMWRTGDDIKASWGSWTHVYDQNYHGLSHCRPGSWADPDMLQVGQVFEPITYDEARSHFSMWCMMSAPLIMGWNMTRMWQVDYQQNRYAINETLFPLDNHIKALRIHTNMELIALNQDTIGLAARRIKGQGALEVWIKNCADGAKAVAFFNRTASAANMSISKAELGWQTATQVYVRDLWAHQSLDPFTSTFTKNVASHATEVYKMHTAPIAPPTEILRKMDRSIAWLRQHGHDPFPQRLIPSVIAGAAAQGARTFDLRGKALPVGNYAHSPVRMLVVLPVKRP